MDWKSIFEKVIIAVIAGSILAFLGWTISPLVNDSQPIKGKIDWVEIRNPLTELLRDTRISMLVGKADANEKIADFLPLAALFGLNNVGELVDRFTYSETFVVGNITISNESDLRSGEVEFTLENGLIVVGAGRSKILDKSVQVKLPPIEPRKSTSVYFIYSGYSSSPIDAIQVLHDNRVVEIESTKTPEDLLFMKPIVEKYPILVFFGLSIAGFLVLLLVALLLTVLFVKDKIAFRAKQLSRNDVADYLKIIDYVTEHFPEKLPQKVQTKNDPLD